MPGVHSYLGDQCFPFGFSVSLGPARPGWLVVSQHLEVKKQRCHWYTACIVYTVLGILGILYTDYTVNTVYWVYCVYCILHCTMLPLIYCLYTVYWVYCLYCILHCITLPLIYWHCNSLFAKIRSGHKRKQPPWIVDNFSYFEIYRRQILKKHWCQLTN